MNGRLGAVITLGFALVVPTIAAPARGQSNPVFGLQNFVVDPPSGVATPNSLIDVQMSGVAGSALVPNYALINILEPDRVEVLLATPGLAGAAIPTSWTTENPLPYPLGPWIQPPMPFQLAPGRYDFYVRGIVGYGTPDETVIGTQLAVEDFIVVPEPQTVLMTLACLLGLVRRRPCFMPPKSFGTNR